MINQTDLAVECYETAEKTKIEGVIVKDENGITTVSVLNENGARQIGKPVGEYVTIQVPEIVNETDIFDGRLNTIAGVLRSLLPSDVCSVLVAGLGNLDITADALGPKANGYVLSTRHLIENDNASMFGDFFNVAGISTGVLAHTGIESAEIVKGIVSEIKPSCVIAIDALAASSPERLGTTIQLSNTGISPGSGVGNHRYEISRKTLGIPVISIGIPTVVSSALFSGDSDEGAMFVTPREIDRITEQGARLIGMSINVCLHKNIPAKDLFSLVI